MTKKLKDKIDEDRLSQWKFYSYALIPTLAPHETIDASIVRSKGFWKAFGDKKPYFARWTTNFDCGYETEWWYVVKDTPYDISTLKAKRRYEINKGIKNFHVSVIKVVEFAEELYEVQTEAYSTYPEKYRPNVDKEKFITSLQNWDKNGYIVFGAFQKETAKLCGYSILTRNGKEINFNVHKAIPQYEKLGVNTALVNAVLEFFSNDLASGYYICDGSRSVNHETAFQDWLEKYFGFRKAYCKLKIAYNPKYKLLIKTAYLFRKIFGKLDNIKIIHKINGVLKMEEIVRRQAKNDAK